MYQNVLNNLSYEQLQFLNRGPTYVIPCQIRLLSTSSSTLAQIFTKQIMPLRRQLTAFFNKYSIDLMRQSSFRRRLENEFIKSFKQPISVTLEKRIRYEKQIMESIRFELEKDQLIFKRTADGYNTYYLGDQTEFQMKSLDYMENNQNCYEVIYTIDEFNSEEQQLNKIIQAINVTLNQLELKRLMSMEYLQKILIRDTTQMKLPYLYFLPEPSDDDNMSVKPRLSSCYKSPIYALATNLEQVLRPLFEKYAQSTKLFNGTDFIQKLEQFTSQSDSFTLNTQFITFEIHNLSTQVTHIDLLNALKRFLDYQLNTKPQDQIKVDRIMELVRLVLSNNIFTYNGKIYRYSRGGPMNLPLMELLNDIYLQYWQLPIVRLVRLNRGFYGRYHQKGILTWNNSTDSFSTCILELNEQHPDVQLTESTGLFVHFLDAYVENVNGRLMTCMYHDIKQTQFFLLPYANKHPRITHRQWFRFALARAIQYCPILADFQEERLQIQLTFLANGYSLDFVEYLTQQFLRRFFPSQNSIYFDQTVYNSFRKQIFQYFNEQNYKLKEEQKPRCIEFYYLYDWGRRHEFNRKFYQLWSEILNADPNFQKSGLKIILTSKHCYLSNTLLAQ